MAASTLLDLFNALGDTYDIAVKRLGCHDLRTFFLHESQWLKHATADEDTTAEKLNQLRVDQASDFLKTLLEVTKTPAVRRRRRANIVPLNQ